MRHFWIIVMNCLIFGKISSRGVDLSFPKNFTIGVGSASYQIEGAWNVNGKGETIWDHWTHNNPGAIADESNGDIACNSYYKYKEDVQLIKSIGFDFYRFSISWSRVLPTGFTNLVSEEGLQYYKNLTAELVANGIQPIVTIYHWDHPQVIEDMGGWTNDLIVDWFVDYARILFEALGDSVKIWITINEPTAFCMFGYNASTIAFAPGKELYGIGVYRCGHNVLKAHAKTYHLYDKEFRATQQGQISIAFYCYAFAALNSSDIVSADTAYQFNCGWMAHPIYVGDYPEIMKSRIAVISKSQGWSRSLLPKFSKKWISIIKGTADYFGVNHYTTRLVSPDPDEELGIYNYGDGLIKSVDPAWPNTTVSWLYNYPQGLGYLLRKIRDEYNNPPVRIMENGYPDSGELNDYARISYHYDYLKELLIAVKRDGCNVLSYSIWSIMDSFEWSSGYMRKFGIVSVDFNHPDRTRRNKLSTSWWTSVLAARKLQPVPTDNRSLCTHPKRGYKRGDMVAVAATHQGANDHGVESFFKEYFSNTCELMCY